MNLISIVTPTYNSSAFIKRLYESLCAQTDRRFEWIVVDDGSTDHTIETLRGLNNEFSGGIHVYRLPFNSGGNSASTASILKSQGDIVVRVDHDDELMPSAVQRIREEFNNINKLSNIAGLLFPSFRSDSGAKLSSLSPNEIFKYSYLLNQERTSLDGLMAYRGDIARTAFSAPSRAMTLLGGLTMLEISRNYCFKYIGGDPLLVYHKDNPQSQTNKIRISNKMVFTYAKILDLHDQHYYANPWQWIKFTMALVRFSCTVYSSPFRPLRWMNKWSTRLWYCTWLPLGCLVFLVRPKAPRYIYPVHQVGEIMRSLEVVRKFI